MSKYKVKDVQVYMLIHLRDGGPTGMASEISKVCGC
jgi:hypothetical protein